MAYDSLDAINKDFGKRIKDTDSDDEKRALALEQREAIADFREVQAVQRELAAHKATVVAEKGLADWAEYVTGTTAEEIDASAAKLSERVGVLNAAVDDAKAAASYGAAGGAAGGAAAGVKVDDEVEKLHDFEKRFNEGTRGSAIRTGNDGKFTVREAEEYVQKIGAARMIDHLARSSSKPEMRALAQKVDLATLKPKA